MKKYNFGEKKKEYSPKANGEVEVWQSPKYLEAKEKVINMLESEEYKNVLTESDFWILMNSTKTGKMAYTGLIISHNGCLKINDTLKQELKFKPECLMLDKEGYNNSLVYSYMSTEQGLYEVGEVSINNCKNDYPYAMAYKRCFDRVVLKNSKLAYSGVYSDSEAEEFKDPLEEKENVEIKTKEEAEQIIINFGKNKGKTLKEVVENDGKYINYLLNNSQDKNIIKGIELLTGLVKLTEEEVNENIQLLSELNNLLDETDTDREEVYKYYKVKNNTEMSNEQIKDAIEKLKKKL